MKVGFIGVGNMGGPMCRNLIKNSGHEILVHDRDAAAVRRCQEVGGAGVGSIAEAVGESDVVFTSLPMPRGRGGGGARRRGDRRERPPGHGPYRPQHQLADHGAEHRGPARAKGRRAARRAGERRHDRGGEGDHRDHGGRRPGGVRRAPSALRIVRQERHLRGRARCGGASRRSSTTWWRSATWRAERKGSCWGRRREWTRTC